MSAASVAFAAEPAIPTHEFFDHAAYQNAKISPTGRYLAVTVPFKEQHETRLAIIDLEGMKVRAVLRTEGPAATFQIGRFFWIGDERVLFESLTKRGDFDVPLRTGQIYEANADGSDFHPACWACWLVDNTLQAGNRIFVWSGGHFFALKGGGSSLQSPIGGGDILADHKGEIRYVSNYYNDKWVVMTRDPDHAGWREVQRIGRSDRGRIRPLAFSADDTHVFLWSDAGKQAGVWSMDVATGQQTPVFVPQGADATGLVYGRDLSTPIGAAYGPKHEVHYFDPAERDAKLLAGLSKAFPGTEHRFTSFTKDGSEGVLFVHSDTDPGQYFLVDMKSLKIQPLVAAAPWIRPESMSTMEPISLKARDGLALNGFLTVPKGTGRTKLPMVVLVHGGPHGIHDAWRFDSEVQFLAYHGYAVLQVNYRGSGGFGHDFQAMGYKRWGREMQDDVTDATKWAIDQGIADKDRICIYGGSYGGYSALMGVEREPDLYRCAVGYAGVYDLEYMYDRGDIIETIEGIDYLKEVLGDDKKDLRARSPVYNVDKIKVPLFLVHGGKDQRAPIGQYDRLVGALKSAGKPFETLVKDNEMHGFYDEANRVELYDKMLDFFNRNTGPRPQQ